MTAGGEGSGATAGGEGSGATAGGEGSGGGTLLCVLAVVGTDHHPFDRLVRTMDEWAAAHVDGPEVFVQYGTAAAPAYATGSAYLGHTDVEARMAAASIVVTHGGPSTIVEARRRGIRPIAMPRRSAHGEHVDDHQVRFVTRLAESGLVTLVDGPDELTATLDRVLRDPSLVRLVAADNSDNHAAVQRFAALVSGLFSRT